VRKSLLITAALLLCLTFASTGRAADLVTNGGFETGDFTGWTMGGATDFTGVLMAEANTGDYAAWLGAMDAPGSIEQDLATTNGGVYTIDFALKTFGEPNRFEVWWGDSMVYQILNGAENPNYSHLAVPVVADSSSTMLRFVFQDPPAWLILDDVRVHMGAVPESGTMIGLAFLAFAVPGLRLMRRR